ncbi:MAG: hypothetical protein FWG26_05230 [Betaproteobacteria bacterium]|nr:hypothetical protein [Betaproteobacteria bacterium]
MRLAVASTFPATDEGYYAFHAMLAHDALHSSGTLYPLGPLHIYPLLLSFVFSWDINHIIALRLCDLVVSALMAWQWFRLMEQESDSLWTGFFLSLFIVFAFNLPIFIQYGFKNSLSVSFIFLIAALRIGLNSNDKIALSWLICGMLTAIAVLFREALLPFAVIGFLSILVVRGRRAALFYATGGLVSALLVLACLAVARGGISNIFEAYSTFSAMARESGKLTAQSLFSLEESLKNVSFLVPIGLALLGGLLTAARRKVLNGRVLFWMAIAAAPLFEVLTKGGYPYHYSTCLLGLSGLAAYLFRTCQNFAPCTAPCVAIVAFVSSLLLSFPQARDVPRNMTETLRRLPVRLAQTSWPLDMISQSNYLQMAQAVKDVAKPNDTLMTSGHYFLLYPLTGLLPPKTDNPLFDPGLFALARQLSPDSLRVRILAENPNIIVLSHRPGTGADILEKALVFLPQYKKIAEIPIDMTKNYGGFSGSVYVKDRD